jgi:hypothetical protein
VPSEQHATKLCQRIGADVVERPEDPLASLDRQRKNDRPQGTSVKMIEPHYGALIDTARESLLERLEG